MFASGAFSVTGGSIRSIAVVGAGPAGLSFATTAAGKARIIKALGRLSD